MGADSPRLYAVPIFAHESVGLKVSEICWGSCGHGQIGGINLDNDAAIPCTQPANRCPAFDKEASSPSGTVDDGRDPEHPVYLRKLKAPWRVIKPPPRERLRKAWLAVKYSPWRARNALREWWTPTCKECSWPMKQHKPLPEPGGEQIFHSSWKSYGIDHVRGVAFSGGALLAIESVSCTGEVDSVLMTYSDAESLRDALDEYLEANK